MSKATLAVILSKLKKFEKPKTYLEQYSTPREIAATIIWDAYMKGLIENKTVVDLGAGTGILGIGALKLGAKKVIFIEKDDDAIKVLKENLSDEEFEGTFEIIQINLLTEENLPSADLVITNPPFGTKNKHADIKFLEQAKKISRNIYSFHKTSTDNLILKWIDKQELTVNEKFNFKFSLGATMKQHNKKAHLVEITCWQVKTQKGL